MQDLTCRRCSEKPTAWRVQRLHRSDHAKLCETGQIVSVQNFDMLDPMPAVALPVRLARRLISVEGPPHRSVADSNRRLLTEVNHRVRNNLAGLLSLVRLTAKSVMTVDEFASAMKARILAMSHVHNMLAQALWSNVQLRDIASTLAGSASQTTAHHVPVELEGPAVSIDPRQATPLAMTFSELFNNSVKHGAHSRPEGHIRVTWRVEETATGSQLCIHWNESGGPSIQRPIRRSLGTQLIEGFIRFELDGECEKLNEQQASDD